MSEPIPQPIFSAKLTPHRSMGPRAFGLLMGFFGITCFAAGTFFFVLGAWPVVGFLGLDIMLIYLAFRLNYRAARAFEIVELDPTRLVIRKVASGGGVEQIVFNPRWIRLGIERDAEEGVTHIRVFSEGRAVPVGTFLNPEDRTDFAAAFVAALAAVKAGAPG